MGIDGVSRRQYVMMIGTSVGTGLAGCAGSDGGSGPESNSGGGSGSTSANLGEFPDLETGDPTFREWLPAESQYQLTGWAATHLSRFRQLQSSLPASDYESATDFAAVGGYVGVDFESMNSLLNSLSGPGTIFPGSFDRDSVASTLTATDYEQYDSSGDVTFYRLTATETQKRVAISNVGLIHDWTGETESFVKSCTALFETAAGDRTRLHEDDERVRQYTADIGWPLQVGGLQPASSGGVGVGGFGSNLPEDVASNVVYGTSKHYSESGLVTRYWLWTSEEADTTPSDVRSALEQNVIDSLGSADSTVALRTEGRVNDIAVSTPIESAGSGVNPPLATLRADVSDGTLTLTHHGGDPVPLDRLTIRTGSDTSSFGSGTLEPGKSVTSALPGGESESVRVIYRAPSDSSTRVVAEG
jgi:hypothetical protein